MGGRSLAWAVMMVFALAAPAYAAKTRTGHDPTGKTKTTKTEIKAETYTKNLAPEFNRKSEGGATILERAPVTQKVERWETVVETEYHNTYKEDISKSKSWEENETYTECTKCVWKYPCPGAGYWADKTATRTVTKTKTWTETETTTDDKYEETSRTKDWVAKTPVRGAFTTIARIGSNAVADLSTDAGAAAAGRDLGFSGDSGSGAGGARSASAGKAKKLSGADKGGSATGSRAFDLSGEWSGGLIIAKGSGGSYDLSLGGFSATAKLKGGKLVAGKGKDKTVDLAVGNEGNSLSGVINGEGRSFSR